MIYTLPAKLHKKGGTNRLTPFIDKSCRIKIFDCFVKTVMRNEYRDAAAEKKRIQNREAKPDLMNVPEIEDVYPSEHFILDNEKYPCLIASDWLYDAMLELPKTQRETLILEFWYGYGDQEIAAYFHVTPRTIYNWRQKAFTAIRKYYERNGDERK
ncbi:MAG: sigma factor-like helix-turn-helix DNA-binding protein [Ruminococcus sp.]|nr:sigma factor-like helix-turn-helix DNA-binding protein [Ruminococcus sp.]